MTDPTLVILAAGMGSRFGGLKQITPVDDEGHMIIDFSMYDAYRAGFRRVAFIIKHAIEDDFKKFVGDRMEKFFEVKYVYQELDKIPAGYEIPADRVKPWGTAHAVACCAGVVDGPFAIINADDYYGAEAFKIVYDYLKKPHGENEHAMVAFGLSGTLSDNGSVTRGVCTVENGMLTDVVERFNIVRQGAGGAFTEDGGKTYTPLAGDTPISMNFWGFEPGILTQLNDGLPSFLDEGLKQNPLKCEYLLPTYVNTLVKEGKASVKVLQTPDSWFGVTYPEDLPSVKASFAKLKASGLYPQHLWK